jgi:hypothetical protein
MSRSLFQSVHGHAAGKGSPTYRAWLNIPGCGMSYRRNPEMPKPELTLESLHAELEVARELITELRQHVAVNNLEHSNLEHRVEALEKRLGVSEAR